MMLKIPSQKTSILIQFSRLLVGNSQLAIANDRADEYYHQGMAYLLRMRLLLPDPQIIDVMDNLRDRISICTWIGDRIESINRLLQSHLNACHECFNPIDRREIQIFAVPFADSARLDGFCNITICPTTILVDVGRVTPADWLALVAHEYAHAHLGYPGHHQEYANILSHLCLGLGLAQPTNHEQNLYSWPPYAPVLDPLAFWRGEVVGV